MTRDGIAGVTVAVVDRNSDLLLRGYGAAAFNPVRPVDPSTTLFRIGSISKTFTYLATMQLVAQGRLKLDEPVNTYLPAPLRLAEDGRAPVLLWNLLSHTAGYEDSALGHLFQRANSAVPTLDEYLLRYRPQRVREPGARAVYSNYSVALLGAIVAHVSGETYESYVEQHILQPLGMQHTTFREPLAASDPRHVAAALLDSWSNGFERRAGGFTAGPFEYISGLSPAGGGSSTAADMARYLRMWLNAGSLDGTTVLGPSTFAELGTTTFRNAEHVGAIAHGLFRLPYGRYQSLEHGGATLYFLSDMVVLPDAGLAVFVSTNTDTGRELATTLPRLIFEHLLGDAKPAPLPPAAHDFASSAQRFVGQYQNERRNYSTLEKFFSAIDSVASVTLSNDGFLLVTAEGQTRRYAQDGALAFRATEGNQTIQFATDASGAITGFAGGYGHTWFDRIGTYDAPSTLLLVMGALMLACVGVVLGAWRRSAVPVLRRARREPTGAGRIMLATAIVWLTLMVLATVALVGIAGSGSAIVFDYPTPLLRWVVALAYVAAGFSALGLVTWPRIWRLRSWSVGRKLRHTSVIVLMLVASAMLWHWNVLGAPLALGR